MFFDSIDVQLFGGDPIYADDMLIVNTTPAAMDYRIGKPITIALIEPPIGIDLDGLIVDVDIARSQNAGTILLNPAYDPEGSNMRLSAR